MNQDVQQQSILQFRLNAVAWAVSRWQAEVQCRPPQNIHYRSLDDTWRQVIRHFGGDDVQLVGKRQVS